MKKLIIRLSRWIHRKRIKLLPEFYQQSEWTFDEALSLTMQYVKHKIYCIEQEERNIDEWRQKVIALEKCVTELRLALVQAGWNEDRVDRYMGTWFGRADLPISQEEINE